MRFSERVVGFDDAIADSAVDFGGKQSHRHWSYGAAPITADGQMGELALCDLYRPTVWMMPQHPQLRLGRDTQTAIWKDGGSIAVVRRWTADRAGSVRLVGWLCKAASTRGAVCFRIYRDGQVFWSRTIAEDDTIPHAFDVLLVDLPKSAKIDLVAVSESKEAVVKVDWKLQIVSETCTAWHPDLPIGPQFTDLQKQAQRDAGKELLLQIKRASDQKLKTFRIPAGDYRYRAGWDPDCPIIEGVRDLQIKASGATFWMEPPLIWGLLVRKCQNLTFRGLTIDFDPLPFFQARVLHIDAPNERVTAEIMPGHEPRTADGIPEDSGQRVMLFFHPDGSFINNYLLGKSWHRIGHSNRIEIETPAPGVFVGDYLAAPIRTGAALRTIECEHIVYEDCNIFASGGMMAMEGGGVGGHVYRRLHGVRRPGTNRLHAFGADGFHMTATEKGPTIERCEVAHLADDHINLHGFFGIVAQRMSAHQYYFAASYGPFMIKQNVDFWDWRSVEHLGAATVTRTKRVTDGAQCELVLSELNRMEHAHSSEVWEVTLDRDLDLPVGTLIDTHSLNCEGFVVRNCWFHDCFNRPFLLNGASGGLVENNTFQNVMHGLEIHYETWGPMTEGQFANDNQFINNRMLGCSTGAAASDAYLQGAIMSVMVPSGGNYLRRSTPIHNMLFKGNYIETPGGVPIYITNMDGLTIKNNIIDRPFHAADWKGFGSAFATTCGDLPDASVFLGVVKNARIENNLVYDPDHKAGGMVKTGPLTRGVVVDGKHKWDCVADFVTGWSHDGIQGQNGWRYGTIGNREVRSSRYRTDAFTAMRRYELDRWVYSLESPYPHAAIMRMHPSDNLAAVKRWVSTVSGRMRVEGTVQNSGLGDGVRLSVFVDGVRKWDIEARYGKPHPVLCELNAIRVGSVLDLVVDSIGSMDNDSTQLYIKLMVPPGLGR
ncbi:MAG: right-handed parallel beta-helix repeat-containing protein [Armatimonadota bacterium]